MFMKIKKYTTRIHNKLKIDEESDTHSLKNHNKIRYHGIPIVWTVSVLSFLRVG